MEKIRFLQSPSSSYSVELQCKIPKKCPICNGTMSPKIISKSYYDSDLQNSVAIMFKCTLCDAFFAKEFRIYEYDKLSEINYTLNSDVVYDIPVEIESISPQFKDIYIQSLKA